MPKEDVMSLLDVKDYKRCSKVILDHPTIEWDFGRHGMELCNNIIPYAVNHNKLPELKIARDHGLEITPYDYYSFVTHYPDYTLWKKIAVALNVPVTIIFGAYDYDGIPFKVYSEMTHDIGADEMLRAAEEDDHEYDCRDIEGYVNQVLNEKALKDAQEETGLPCPEFCRQCVNMYAH